MLEALAVAIVAVAILAAIGYVLNANAIDDTMAKLRAEMIAGNKYSDERHDRLTDRVAALEVADRRRLQRVLRAPLKAVKKDDGGGGTGGTGGTAA